MATNAELVAQVYVGFYDRAPDPTGLAYWVGRLEAGVSIQDIGDSFAASPEASDTYPYFQYPDLLSPADFLAQVYQNVFGRAIDPDGAAYYLARMESGESAGSVVASILGNASTNEGSPDQAFLQNKVDAGLHWAMQAASANADIYQENGRLTDKASDASHAVLDGITADPSTVEAANAATDAYFEGEGPGATFTLTPGLDFADVDGSGRGGPVWLPDTGFKFTDANEIVNATQATLSAADTLLDGSTTDHDTLNVAINGSANPVNGAVVANIENINVTLTNGSGNFGLGNYTGVQNLMVSGSVAAAGIAIGGLANSGVSTIDLTGITSTDNVGFDVAVNSVNADQDITLTSGDVNTFVNLGDGDNSITTGAADDVVQVGIGNNTIDVGDGINVVVINTDGDATTVDGNNTITSGSGVDAVTINGDGDNTISTGGASDSVVINGAGDNTIDTGAGNDAVTINGTGDNTVTTGDGADVVTVAAAATGDNTIDTGAGNDVINLAGGTNVVTAGAGTDAITITGGTNELVFHFGDTGITGGASTDIDTVTGFVTGTDTISFGGVNGSVANFNDAGGVADYAAALAAADAVFGTVGSPVEYVVANDGAANTWVFYDSDHNGNSDMAVHLTGVIAVAATDLVA